jgi:hypothetical protein
VNRISISFGEALAAAGGILLLLSMFVLDWFVARVAPAAPELTGTAGGAVNAVNAFGAFTFIDMALVICVVVLVITPLVSPGAVGARVVTAAAAIAAVLILFRLIRPPGLQGEIDLFQVTIDRGPGGFIGLGFALLAVLGGVLAVRQAGSEARALQRAAQRL